MQALWLSLLLGAPVPDFTLTDLGGRTDTLSEWRSARLVVVAFLGNGCPLVRGGHAPALRRRPAHSAACRRPQDGEDVASPRRRAAAVDVSAHAPARQVVPLRGALPRRPPRSAAGRAPLRLQLAAPLRAGR